MKPWFVGLSIIEDRGGCTVVASPWAILHLQDGKCGTRLVPRVEDAVEEYDVGIVNDQS
jgi:hypothetical protein